MTAIKKVLHPTDFSEVSGYAFQLACALARDFGSKLILVHVRPLPVVVPVEAGAPSFELPDDSDDLRRQLNALRPHDPEVPVERHLLVGDEATEIDKLAAMERCDLIVMGTHGRTGFGRVFLGSVAEKVVRTATCPVLTIKRPLPGAEAAAGFGTEVKEAVIAGNG